MDQQTASSELMLLIGSTVLMLEASVLIPYEYWQINGRSNVQVRMITPRSYRKQTGEAMFKFE